MQQLVAGLRGIATLAGMARIAVLAAACSSGSPPDLSVALGQFVQCMRSHGYPTWPDPSDQNGYNTQPLPPANIDTSSPQLQAAAKACGMFLPPGGRG